MNKSLLAIPIVAALGIGAGSVALLQSDSSTPPAAVAPAVVQSGYVAVAPTRLIDSRLSGRLIGGQVVTVQTGHPEATSAVVNITLTETAGFNYVTVWNGATVRPEVSAVNSYESGQTIANEVTVELTSGNFNLFTFADTQVIVDLVGIFTPITTSTTPPTTTTIPATTTTRPTTTTTAPATTTTVKPTTTTAAPATTIGTPVAHFFTLGVNATLPNEATCASQVKPHRETNASTNSVQNQTRGVTKSTSPRTTGNYVGTTDQIIQWAACKWGIDEDIVRAVARQESGWSQTAAGDWAQTSDPSQCGAGQTIQNGGCAYSIGITQVMSRYYGSYDHDSPWTSTAYNLDVWGTEIRACFNGQKDSPYMTNQGYTAGDFWACIGWWYSGNWHDSGGAEYIAAVQQHLNSRDWPT